MDNQIKNFISSLNLFKGGGGDSAVGVDIGSSAIKVVEIKKRGAVSSFFYFRIECFT